MLEQGQSTKLLKIINSRGLRQWNKMGLLEDKGAEPRDTEK